MLTPIVHEKLDKSFYALKICQMRWKCMQDMTPTFPYNLEKISYIYLPIYIPNLDNFLTKSIFNISRRYHKCFYGTSA